MSSIYDALSAERKKLQDAGEMPQSWSTGGWQLFKENYLYQATTPKEQYQRIAKTLAVHTPDPDKWSKVFFDLMWKGWLSPSTPVLANTGTSRGLPVSCAGNYVDDSIYGIFESKQETAMLTKNGFGTSSYLGDIRPRGTPIGDGGKAEGIMPVIKGMHQDMSYVRQGGARRGSWAGYVPMDHGDFDEVCTYLKQNPDDNNIGWNVSNAMVDLLDQGDPEAVRRYGEAMATKMTTGKGYYWFPDKANDRRPQWYKDHGLDIKAAQLCNEISLHSSAEYTYTCVLASMNLALYDEWKDTTAVFDSIVFLDAVCQEFIDRAKNIKGLEKAVAFTRKSRALGLGVMGYSTYLQANMIPFESLEADFFNVRVFKQLREDAEEATKWLAEQWGEPEWCKGYGRANSHLIAVAPTKSTALIMGGVTEGIAPDMAMVYNQRSAGGEVDRINVELLKLMKRKGVYNARNVEEVRDAMGSVQGVSWLTDEEKLVFKNAFEIDQRNILAKAIARAPFIDQWQSLNLFFSGEDSPEYINEVHKMAFKAPEVLGLYYVYSKAGISVSRDECLACD